MNKITNKRKKRRKLMALVEVSEELSFRTNHRYIINRKTNNIVCMVPWQLWTIISNCHFYIKYK